ncbi:ribonuclease P protein component [Frigidibacter sp. MR17.24]|uniref:ribonuclease P protein component n=1 Tax=Frigidibacter sp. MR17.24 TaxID=3127345 RepID=UPI003012B282
MTPPVAPVPDAGPQPAVSLCPTPAAPARATPQVLAKRADFLRAAQARRQSAPGFLLQARERREGEPAAPDALRVGFTCSKKVGNAVTRNRAKRRLRALAAEFLPLQGRPGWDYVLIGRPEVTVARSFAEMRAELSQALERVHDAPVGPRPPRSGPRKGRKA